MGDSLRFFPHAEFPHLAAGAGGRVHLLLTAEAEATATERAPLNIGLVLDRSGSMRGDKIRATLESARILVDRLSRRDRLCVVFYDTEVEVALKPTPLEDRDAVAKILQTTRARGTTNLSGGWLQGLRLVEKAAKKGAASRVLLMTDGQANRGIVDRASLEKVAEKARRKGVVTTTIGFGAGFNEDLLTGVARAGGGNFHFIENPDDAPRAFSAELGDALDLAAQNLQITLALAPGIRLREVLNPFPHTLSATGVDIFVGDVFAGDRRSVLLALEHDPLPEGEAKVLEARFEYDDLSAGGETGRATLTVSLPVREAPLPAPSKEVELAAALHRCAKAKTQARRLANAGDLRKAADVLDRALRELHDLPERPEIERERRELRRFADDFRSGPWSPAGAKSLSQSIFVSQAGRLSAPGKRKIDKTIADTHVEGDLEEPQG